MSFNPKDSVEAADKLLGMLRDPNSNLRWAMATSRVAISNSLRHAVNAPKINLSGHASGVSMGMQAYLVFSYGFGLIFMLSYGLLTAYGVLFGKPNLAGFAALGYLLMGSLWFARIFFQAMQNLRAVWHQINRRFQRHAIATFLVPIFVIAVVAQQRF
jgi:hypothetical protein